MLLRAKGRVTIAVSPPKSPKQWPKRRRAAVSGALTDQIPITGMNKTNKKEKKREKKEG